MDRSLKAIIVMVALAFSGILITINFSNGHNDQNKELAGLRTGNISSINVTSTINPNYLDFKFDQNQTVRLVHALNHGLELPELMPDRIISMEIIITLSNGKQIVIGDYGESEFLVTINEETKPQSIIIASTDLKDLLLPYQILFSREISLKKNISLYGTDRITGYILEDTSVHEEASHYSEEAFTLKKGNLVRTLARKVSHGVEWIFIDPVAFSIPNPVGWIESTKIATQLPTMKPNQGFVKDVNIFAQPSFNSVLLQENYTAPAQIMKRAGNWTNCSFAGGLDGWVEESDILYSFPAGYDMGY